jgi:UTP--glucose-1-phosphate uridylyltransferase
MSEAGLRAARDKMQGAGVEQTAIDVFSHYYRQLETGATGVIREDSISPLPDPPSLAELAVPDDQAREALSRTVILKLNGGLGTSMGMDRAKSLLPVRDGRSFLDLIVAQVLAARSRYGVSLPLLLMDSFRTRSDTLAALARYADLPVAGLPQDFLQNQEPKLLTEDLSPVTWDADPTLEWCPPGHGDIYTALLGTGILEALLEQGYRYAATSNSDNLGAAPNATLAGWFAASGAPYAAEVCPRTPADLKGGHLAVRRADGRLILREVAQTAPEDMADYTDPDRHRYFHTNNLWFDLQALHAALVERKSVLGLPLIRNVKNVDPADKTSPEVFQIETAMGAAIEVFEGATAIVVGRDRFLPVKTTNDLLLVRSDAYDVDDLGRLLLAVPRAPFIDLDPAHYRTVAEFDARFPAGPPSLREASSLTVRGDWRFGADVVVRGEVALDPGEGQQQVPDGTVLSG